MDSQDVTSDDVPPEAVSPDADTLGDSTPTDPPPTDAAPEEEPMSRLPKASGPLPVRLLFWNAFLLKPRPIPHGPGLPAIGEMAAPAVGERAAAIGRALFGRHDIMAFAEVFDQREQRLIMDGWSGRPRVSAVSGPDRSLLGGPLGFASSGLYTITNRLKMQRVERHKFATRGSYLHDADALANKGVMLTEIDPGVHAGRLEVFSTHLFYGGGLLPKSDVGDAHRRHRIRMAQVAELVEFVQRVHRPGNVIVLVGDFNIPAVRVGYPDGETAEYDELMERLAPLDLGDVWADHGLGVGVTCGNARDSFADQTDPDLLGGLRDDDPEPDATDSEVAADLLAERERIDYLFVQRPQPEHTLDIEIARPRRMAYPRDIDATDRVKLPRLSDHLALTVRLLPSAR